MDGEEEITNMEELLKYLQSLAEDIPYLDPDYSILVLEECTKPFIVMGPEDYMELERKVIGYG